MIYMLNLPTLVSEPKLVEFPHVLCEVYMYIYMCKGMIFAALNYEGLSFCFSEMYKFLPHNFCAESLHVVEHICNFFTIFGLSVCEIKIDLCKFLKYLTVNYESYIMLHA